MSKVLMIRHLPIGLSFQDKEQLLKHFGADKVWETSKRNYIFADFGTVEKAKSSLTRLHQLEIANRRLVVEYAFVDVPTKSTKSTESSATTKLVMKFLRSLNAWNPSLDFYQPPPPHLKYKYPEPNPHVFINIIYALATHKPLYTQILHLMNKMCLNVPFEESSVALQFFKDTFCNFFLDLIPPIPPESDESELSSDENKQNKEHTPTLVKRKHKLPIPSRKRKAYSLHNPTASKVKKSIDQSEVFESVAPLQDPKKISLVVHQDALQKPFNIPEPQEVGELGKFKKEEQPVEKVDTPVEPEQPSITKKELLQNRISYKDMKILPVFKNYHPGQPSMRLYIKNLAKTVTEQDVKRIYRRYIEKFSDDKQIGFDVGVMQEGRMKGQAFVTFPSIDVAETALNETNGFMLKEEPMVVQFARAANKKSID